MDKARSKCKWSIYLRSTASYYLEFSAQDIEEERRRPCEKTELSIGQNSQTLIINMTLKILNHNIEHDFQKRQTTINKWRR